MRITVRGILSLLVGSQLTRFHASNDRQNLMQSSQESNGESQALRIDVRQLPPRRALPSIPSRNSHSSVTVSSLAKCSANKVRHRPWSINAYNVEEGSCSWKFFKSYSEQPSGVEQDKKNIENKEYCNYVKRESKEWAACQEL